MVLLFFWFATLAAGWYFLQLADLLIYDSDLREYNTSKMNWSGSYRSRDRQRVFCALALSSTVLLYTAVCSAINWLGFAGVSFYFYGFQFFLLFCGLTAYASRLSALRLFARPIAGPRYGREGEIERIWVYIFGFELASLALALAGPLLMP